MVKFRHIPPTQFLKGFEAASRLESFSRAAEELGLSQSAISHQMRLLEGHIGQPLFMRFGREVRLTDAGRDYQRTVRRCLDLLEEGYRRLEPYRKPGSVVIYAPRDFSRRWLLHRLPALRAAVPACEPWLDTGGASVDFETMELDLAIIYADAPPEGCESLLIARDFLSPVATKDLASTLHTPADLLGVPLIHDERPTGWADWLRSARRRAKRHLARHQFQRQRPRACGRRVQPGRGAGQPVFGSAGACFRGARATIRAGVGRWSRLVRNFYAGSAPGCRCAGNVGVVARGGEYGLARCIVTG